MSRITEPPLFAPVVDQKGIASLEWTLFFNQLFTGDNGTQFSPNIVGMTGNFTVSGVFYRLSRKLTYFRLNITPNGNTTSTAGSTYVDNFPQEFSADGVCFSSFPSAGLGGSLGSVSEQSNRIFLPAWTDVSVPIVINGAAET